MGFVKVLKNKAYHKRYQTKFRRRRQGKTDYFARRRMVFQDKNKYDSKKYRLVVRRTNRRIIASINYFTLTGDRCMASADSLELRQHGLEAGLTNYAAAYATGLLVARRLLTEKKMNDLFKGTAKVDGKLYDVFEEFEKAGGDRRPFKAYLDVGLIRTTTGNRVFGALKGACDGGLHVPHNTKRFPGASIEKSEGKTNKRGKKEEEAEKSKLVYKPEVHKEHIFGGHVETYYNHLKKEDPSRFKKQFSRWETALGKAKVKDFAALYAKVHESIRKSPVKAKAAAKKPTRKVVQPAPTLIQEDSKGRKWLRQKRISLAARKARSAKKLAALLQRA